ncbi:nitrogen fixation protein [Azotobacter chroococcum]|jgi:predicted Fe-Mo cluster-binding NifX family protein|uniref:Nitrogen fixation-related protein n=2 Tax=Azotobacter chroococcum TaxID=353 RepID=A0A0C4WRQ6_9GAMM|nr:nitrogen fixation protein [Azotobacter chroococcum]AJE23319.1 Nitrogen fixation-related protein [Azotobacter chroococcum NCIMB 8003]ASL28368.1 nitrogen fixation protein [Azotobacter chroococcum]TBV93485.1 nitrogen fixation protein [Azotobacter chroococcum]TBW36706.1 nitrogen fixation protein [Azotobacter chroococcum]TCL33360.1 putative Fe-Mo cluster-binding NifX family protein [Azotobacter chroococcum]
MSEERRLIAVAVDRQGRVADHAGRAQRWEVFDVWPGQAPVNIYAIELAEKAVLHHWHVTEYPERHPLHVVDLAIAATAGEGVIRRLGERGVSLLTTGESDPELAVKAFLAGDLPPGKPHDEHSCGGEGHQH